MTARHYEALQALKQCNFLPASWDKRFVRDLSALPQDAELTERQAANVERLAYRYRRQIGRLIAFGNGSLEQIAGVAFQEIAQEVNGSEVNG